MMRILQYTQQTGEPLPFEAEQTLEQMAEEYNISVDELLAIFNAGQTQ